MSRKRIEDVLIAVGSTVLFGAMCAGAWWLFNREPERRTFIVGGELIRCVAKTEYCGMQLGPCDGLKVAINCAHDVVEVVR